MTDAVPRAQFALMLHSVPHLGPRGIARILRETPDAEVCLPAVRAWRMSPDALQSEYKLHAEAAHCIALRKDELLSSSAKIASAAEGLRIRTLTEQDADYPSMLRDYQADAPPIVYAHGNLGLLRDRKYAVVNSAKIGGRSIEATRDIASTLAAEGLAAVTSHNTQGYQIVGLAAKSRNAPILLVLDRGILSAFPQGLGWEPVAQARIWNLRFDPERDLVVSPFRLYDRWIGANGRERDRMVFALADVVVAVEIRAGGVMEAECLRALRLGREVYVCESSDGPLPGGNASLLSRGCAPIPVGWEHSMLATLDLPIEGSEEAF
ncbi:MAG: DNA-processing protein DprA [Armatimonadetes bacterium]|nr:DNA-processing protein DprA [Armatimonadota bacterium]